MNRPYVFDFRVAYADTDAGGIVYHARYIEIAERARGDASKDVKDAEGGFVIRELSVKYIKPFRVGDIITVETKFIGRGGASMDVEQIFKKDGAEHAVLTGTAVYVDKNLKPARIPDAWLALANN